MKILKISSCGDCSKFFRHLREYCILTNKEIINYKTILPDCPLESADDYVYRWEARILYGDIFHSDKGNLCYIIRDKKQDHSLVLSFWGLSYTTKEVLYFEPSDFMFIQLIGKEGQDLLADKLPYYFRPAERFGIVGIGALAILNSLNKEDK